MGLAQKKEMMFTTTNAKKAHKKRATKTERTKNELKKYRKAKIGERHARERQIEREKMKKRRNNMNLQLRSHMVALWGIVCFSPLRIHDFWMNELKKNTTRASEWEREKFEKIVTIRSECCWRDFSDVLSLHLWWLGIFSKNNF